MHPSYRLTGASGECALTSLLTWPKEIKQLEGSGIPFGLYLRVIRKITQSQGILSIQKHYSAFQIDAMILTYTNLYSKGDIFSSGNPTSVTRIAQLRVTSGSRVFDMKVRPWDLSLRARKLHSNCTIRKISIPTGMMKIPMDALGKITDNWNSAQ